MFPSPSRRLESFAISAPAWRIFDMLFKHVANLPIVGFHLIPCRVPALVVLIIKIIWSVAPIVDWDVAVLIVLRRPILGSLGL